MKPAGLFRAAVLLAASCSNLQTIPDGVCGNGAVEPGEDCDGASPVGTCGAAGSPNACHFVCSGGATCPTGDACGVDQRCRSPSGTFASAGGAIAFPTSSFRTGDVDGDGYTDLIGINANQLDVMYGNPSGQPTVTSSQGLAATSTVATGDLDGDGRIDVVIANAVGISTLLGTASRTFTPYPYVSHDFDGTLGATATSAMFVTSARGPDGVPAVIEGYDIDTDLPGSAVNQLRVQRSDTAVCFDGQVAGVGVCPSAPTVETLLNGVVAVGTTGYVLTCCGGSGSSCATTQLVDDPSDEVVVAGSDSNALAFMTVCEDPLAGSSAFDPATTQLQLVANLTLAGTSHVGSSGAIGFADLDGDGAADLVVPLANDSIAVFFNQLDGTFPPQGVTMAISRLKELERQNGTLVGRGSYLAYVDLDGDGFADIVASEQIFHNDCAATERAAGASGSGAGTACRGAGSGSGGFSATGVVATPREWTNAIPIDINHDGRIDLVGFIAGEGNIDVLLNTSTPGQLSFDAAELTTAQPVQQILTADYNGDLLPDLAIVTTDDAGNGTLLIAYGSADNTFADPIASETLGPVDSIANTSIDVIPDERSSIGDLIVLARSTDAGGHVHRDELTLIGNASNQLVPLLPKAGITSLFIGPFDGSAGNDVLAIDNNAEPPSGFAGEVSVLSGIGGGNLQLPTAETPIDVPLGECSSEAPPVTCSTTPPSCPSVGSGAIVSQPAVLDGCYTGGCLPAPSGSGSDLDECSAPVHDECVSAIGLCGLSAGGRCPDNTLPGTRDGCWDGYCYPIAACAVLASTTTDESTGPPTGTAMEALLGFRAIAPTAALASTCGSAGSAYAESDVFVFEPAAGSDPASIVHPVAVEGHACERPRALSLRDFDGDGHLDAIYSTCETETACTEGATYIVHNDQATTGSPFDFSTAARLPPAENAGLQCGRFVAIQLDADPEPELVAPCVSASGQAELVLADDTDGHGTWKLLGAFPIDADVLAIALGDFNGDGLVDVALGEGSSSNQAYRVYLQCAAGDASCDVLPLEPP